MVNALRPFSLKPVSFGNGFFPNLETTRQQVQVSLSKLGLGALKVRLSEKPEYKERLFIEIPTQSYQEAFDHNDIEQVNTLVKANQKAMDRVRNTLTQNGKGEGFEWRVTDLFAYGKTPFLIQLVFDQQASDFQLV